MFGSTKQKDNAGPSSVLIIGAGAAGLTAGHILEQNGIAFEILEASETFGGRLKKAEDFADFPIDLGAEWIHSWIGARPSLLQSVMDGTHEKFPRFLWAFRTASRWKSGRMRKFRCLQHVWPYVLPEYKFTNSTWFDVFDQLITASVKARIHFNSPVSSINYEGSRVLVSTASGKVYEADKVLVTVPIKILQNESIQFSPPLPRKQLREIHKEVMPGGLKMFIEFSERFYPDVILAESLFQRTSGKSYYDAAMGKGTERHVLGMLVDGGPWATTYESLGSEEAVVNSVLAELDEMFNGRATATYVKHIMQNWSAEPFIQGTYSHRKASARTLAAPLDRKVYFAGEAMNLKGRTIAVHGACESAYLSLKRMFDDHRKVVR